VVEGKGGRACGIREEGGGIRKTCSCVCFLESSIFIVDEAEEEAEETEAEWEVEAEISSGFLDLGFGEEEEEEAP
jgi:hypothetical protein